MLTSQVSGHSIFQQTEKDTGSFALNASIAEVINVTFNYVSIQNINGELPVGVNLKINNVAKFDKVVVNHAFVEQADLGHFKINSHFIG